MSNSASVTVHLWDAGPLIVEALYDTEAARASACDPDLVRVYLGAESGVSILMRVGAAAELARQLTAHLAGIARRENLAQAREIAEGGG